MKEPFIYIITRPLITLLFKIFYRPKIIGKENIPKDTKIILAGNHTNNLDSILLISSTKRIIHFLGKQELFEGPKGLILKRFGIIPVNRKIHDKDALNSAIKVLKENKVIGIFPEGTINRTKETIMSFKIGAVKMASETESMIVPFTITGQYKIFKKNIELEFYKPYGVPKQKDLTKENEKLMNIIKSNLEAKKGKKDK